MDTPFENEEAKRFGILPSFFRLSAADPKIAANLWGFAQFANLDSSLPSLFKDRLFVYLSRFFVPFHTGTDCCPSSRPALSLIVPSSPFLCPTALLNRN